MWCLIDFAKVSDPLPLRSFWGVASLYSTSKQTASALDCLAPVIQGISREGGNALSFKAAKGPSRIDELDDSAHIVEISLERINHDKDLSRACGEERRVADGLPTLSHVHESVQPISWIP